MKRIIFVCLFLCLTTTFLLSQPTDAVLYNFTGGSDGSDPLSNLTPDGAGNYYGMTVFGALGYGTVFEISPNGGGWNETTLYTFPSGFYFDPEVEASKMVFDAFGNLYGIAPEGDNGVLFELSLVGGNWIETNAFTFSSGGYSPIGGDLPPITVHGIIRQVS
jgi:hypothetical protein